MDFIDAYDLQAKLKPVLVVVAPAGFAFAANLASPDALPLVSWVAGLSAFGIAAVATAIARDRGKRMEPLLFDRWGGKPTSVVLRHSDSTIDPLLKIRYRLNLQRIVPGFTPPQRLEETQNPRASDRKYDVAIRWLIEHTSDKSKYAKLFSHNCEYGFRRNLYGLRLYGFASCALATAMAIWIGFATGISLPLGLATAACVVGWYVFGFVVDEKFVKRAAWEYATHLIAASDSLVALKKPTEQSPNSA